VPVSPTGGQTGGLAGPPANPDGEVGTEGKLVAAAGGGL
jgi:hypothetical protein